MSSSIYLDNSATTKVRPEVVEAMLPYLSESFGNASSLHLQGKLAKEGIEKARQSVAKLLNCQPEEIYFSPCGTYSNNAAIIGRARFAEANGQGRHLITTAIEHPSVIGPAKHLEAQGWKVTYLPVDAEGFIDLAEFKQAVTKETSIISIMWANNEIGTIEPIEEIVAFAHERGIYFHTDAVQTAGKLEMDMAKTPISTLSLSGHKFYAPKGIGVLYVRSGVNLMPVVFGAGQEKGLFPGTQNLASIVGIGVASELAHKELKESYKQLRKAQQILTDSFLAIKGVRLTGPKDPEKRVPGHVSVGIQGAEGEAIILRSDMQGICLSSGSACHSGVIEPSSVLKAIGLPREYALGSARISAGRFNSEEEVLRAAEVLSNVFKKLVKEPAAQSKS
jgi:cysteine desulfurase